MAVEKDPLGLPSASEIRFNTRYGATSMLNQVAKNQTKASGQRGDSLTSLIGSLARMQRQQTMRTPRGPAPRGPRGPGRKQRGGPKRRGKMPMSGNKKLNALAHAIGVQESGGGYGAYNASSGASGKYQILKGNFVGPGGWDKEALGRDIRYRYYMRHPRAQERIARHKLKQYMRSYGLRGAAQAWYGGPGAVGNNNISGGAGYPTTGGYADSIMGMIRRYLRRHR